MGVKMKTECPDCGREVGTYPGGKIRPHRCRELVVVEQTKVHCPECGTTKCFRFTAADHDRGAELVKRAGLESGAGTLWRCRICVTDGFYTLFRVVV